MAVTGANIRTEGKQCRRCQRTEAACARTYPCCVGCAHWPGWSRDGEPPVTGDRRAPVADELTARRRELWRERYRARRAS